MLQIIECVQNNFLQIWFVLTLLWITYKTVEPRCISERDKEFQDVSNEEERYKPKVDLSRIVVDLEVYKRAEELEEAVYTREIQLTGKQVLDIALVVSAKLKGDKKYASSVYRVGFKALALIEFILINNLSEKGYNIIYAKESLLDSINNEVGYFKNNNWIEYVETPEYTERLLAYQGISKHLINNVISIIKESKMKSKLIIEDKDWEDEL